MTVTRFTVDLNMGSASAIAFLLWELIITFDREVDFIWSKPRTSWIKWAFLFARYFPLMAGICGRAIDTVVVYRDPIPIPLNALRIWYICQVLVLHLMMLGAEIVMMARVYALYSRNRYIGGIFLLLLLGESTSVIVGLALNLPSEIFNPDDLLTTSSKSYIYFGVSAMISQVVILAFSIYRYIRGDWRGVPLVSLMIRDGTLAFGVLFFVSLLLVIFTASETYPTPTFAWLINFISAAECRLILNMQQIPVPYSTYRTSDTPLTTFLVDNSRQALTDRDLVENQTTNIATP
ncbi:uncharacterized protein EV420DRAFT_1529565 [Desarmillaria tabescens]|uniref:DUF6533 domain-containing protein n=1 Tax=Armillaria tabescens TaxID=1929756 RepID=A0AA39TNJ7_ARMTA|nr:uncharacterized protein EV420DRAFT_1529565 [Desarmillaria tabescens]KAK0460993.1 hypothetical protein EV420DRAFT_1529565 [Desarmillaria tabescens]